MFRHMASAQNEAPTMPSVKCIVRTVHIFVVLHFIMWYNIKLNLLDEFSN